MTIFVADVVALKQEGVNNLKKGSIIFSYLAKNVC